MVYGFDENLNKIDVKDKTTQEGVDSGQDSRLTALETGKQDKLTAGTGITIDGTIISAEGASYGAGTGITIGDDNSINHSNSVTAKTSYVGSGTAVPRIKYDAQGHITAMSTSTIYPPTTPGSSGQLWVSDGSGAGKWKHKITISTDDPSSGSDGDLWFKYE